MKNASIASVALLTFAAVGTGCSLNQFRGPAQEEVHTCAEKALIENAEDQDDQILLREGRGGYLYTFVDKAGSRISPDENHFKMEFGGAPGSKYAIHVKGRTGTGGEIYAGVGFDFKSTPETYEAKQYKGLAFSARIKAGSEEHWRFMVGDVNTDPKGKVCKECDNDWGTPFKPTEEWTRYEVLFSDLKQEAGWGQPRPPTVDTAKLFGMKWQMATPNAAFDLWVDDISFVGCPQ
jgi:hypothetical protein